MNERAENARRILENPLFEESIATVRERYRDMIEQTPVSDDKALLDIRKMLHLLREVEQHIQTALEDGKLDEFRVAQQKRTLKDYWNVRGK